MRISFKAMSTEEIEEMMEAIQEKRQRGMGELADANLIERLEIELEKRYEK